VVLLGIRHRAEEEPRLAVVIGETLRPLAKLLAAADVVALVGAGIGVEAAARVLARAAGCQRVRLVGDAALGDRHAHVAVALEVAHRADRLVDRDLVEVRSAEADELGIDIGEEPPLEQLPQPRDEEARQRCDDVAGAALTRCHGFAA
jgi:hypothetical protein